MFRLFYPHGYVESVFSIDYEALYQMGYRGILFDIDNTLVPHGKDSTEEVDDLFRRIHATGFKTLLLSNNSETRILRFLRNIDSLYIPEAGKPHPEGYRQAVRLLKLKKEEVLMIGDQIFTDILGANRSGIKSILVQYIGTGTETKIGIRRTLEKGILYIYKRHCKNWMGALLPKEDRYAKK